MLFLLHVDRPENVRSIAHMDSVQSQWYQSDRMHFTASSKLTETTFVIRLDDIRVSLRIEQAMTTTITIRLLKYRGLKAK